MSLPYEYLPASGAAQQELVLLHGWGSDREIFRPLLVLLRPWANVTLIDLPGCAPGLESTDVTDLAQTLAAVLACCPATAVYIGWSLGGQLASELAHVYPERVTAVVTICSNPKFVAVDHWPGMEPEAFREFRDSVADQPAAALKRFNALQASGAGSARHLLRQLHGTACAQPGDELLLGLHWLETLDQRDYLTSTAQPQLHMLAAADALVPIVLRTALEVGAAAAQCVDVRTLPATCHLAPLEAPGALAVEIRRFLARNNLLDSPAVAVAAVAKSDVAASFSRAASHYDAVAHLQRDVGMELLDHLDQWPGQPRTVLDLGCGTGFFHGPLKDRYPAADYIGLDIAQGMVDFARARCPQDCQWLVADAESIPLASDSIDIVFSSLAVQWCYRPAHLFAELSRVLRPGGICVFTSLGPDTLRELRAAWQAVDAQTHVNTFMPIAALVAAADGVPGIRVKLESKIFCLEYASVRDLLSELKTLGAHNMNRNRSTGLTSRRVLQGMLRAYEEWRSDNGLPATYDAIFGVLEKA